MISNSLGQQETRSSIAPEEMVLNHGRASVSSVGSRIIASPSDIRQAFSENHERPEQNALKGHMDHSKDPAHGYTQPASEGSGGTLSCLATAVL